MSKSAEDKSKNLLITGATGFVGAYLLRYLLHLGYTNIRAVRRKESDMRLVEDVAGRVEWAEGNILDPVFMEDALSGIQNAYHCAAVVSFDPRDARYMMQANVEGTANFVNAALYHNTSKAIHVSSISTLGRIHEGALLNEKSGWQRSRFNTRYAISKFQSEQEVWRGIAEGLNAAIVNPSVILGSGFWDRGTARFFKMGWRGVAFYPAGTTGFVDVRDVVRFMAELMESPISGERYVLNAENFSYRELMAAIAAQFGNPPPRFRVARWMTPIAWRLAWLYARLSGKPPFLTRETARQSQFTFYYDSGKSIRDLSFSYRPIRETIAEACQQLREASKEGFPPRVLPFH